MRAVRDAVAGCGLAAAAAGRSVTVVVPDATRPLDPEVLDPVLAAAAGARTVEVLVGTGLHRPPTAEERAPWAAVCARYGARLRAHDAGANLVRVRDDVGAPDGPLPAVFDAGVVQADLRIVVGLVEPHQYAGFSGGVKGVAIGCAGAETIAVMHGRGLLRDPGTRLGRRDGNPFAAALDRLAATLGPIWAVQVVPADPPRVFAGPVAEAHAAAVAEAEGTLFADHARRYPAVRVSVPAAKAASFYQASRAATYIAEVAAPVVPEGGALLIEAACPEGLGQGAGERAFAAALARGPEVLRAELAGERAPPDAAPSGGAQRAYVLARTLARYRLGIAGAPEMPALARFGVVQAASMPALEAALGLSAPPVELPNVFSRVPRYRPSV